MLLGLPVLPFADRDYSPKLAVARRPLRQPSHPPQRQDFCERSKIQKGLIFAPRHHARAHHDKVYSTVLAQLSSRRGEPIRRELLSGQLIVLERIDHVLIGG